MNAETSLCDAGARPSEPGRILSESMIKFCASVSFSILSKSIHDVAETSRSLKHELAYQYSLISQITVKTSIEVIRGRFHGEEGNRPDLKLEFYFYL